MHGNPGSAGRRGGVWGQVGRGSSLFCRIHVVVSVTAIIFFLVFFFLFSIPFFYIRPCFSPSPFYIFIELKTTQL